MKNTKLLLILCSIVVMLMIPLGNMNNATSIVDVNKGNTEECPKLSNGDILFEDDFENGLSNWKLEMEWFYGLWHLTDEYSNCSLPYHSETHAMWFGINDTGNYNNGSRVWGSFYSIPFDLSDQDEAYLTFYHWRETEEDSYFDQTVVSIRTLPLEWVSIYRYDYEDVDPWGKITIDISSYCGNSRVLIMFTFDSMDENNNDYTGWLVDDIMITNYLDDDGDDDDDDDDDGKGDKKSDGSIGGGVMNFLLSPIGLITVGSITAAVVTVVIVVWVIKKKSRR
ncbi:MAG: hypothetical protein ACFFAN_18565 [Promethearchaeota archaeon]